MIPRFTSHRGEHSRRLTSSSEDFASWPGDPAQWELDVRGEPGALDLLLHVNLRFAGISYIGVCVGRRGEEAAWYAHECQEKSEGFPISSF